MWYIFILLFFRKYYQNIDDWTQAIGGDAPGISFSINDPVSSYREKIVLKTLQLELFFYMCFFNIVCCTFDGILILIGYLWVLLFKLNSSIPSL